MEFRAGSVRKNRTKMVMSEGIWIRNALEVVCFWRLSGICIHRGRAGEGGHFVAYIRALEGSGWLCCNDQSVLTISLASIRSLLTRSSTVMMVCYLVVAVRGS